MRILDDHGIRKDLIFSDVASGRTMNRTGWLDLMALLTNPARCGILP